MKLIIIVSLIAYSVAIPLTLDEDLEAHNALYNPDLFEGDIILGENQTDLNAIPNDTQRWPGNVIPYIIDSSLSGHIDLIKEAMNVYAQHTCIRWKQRTNERDYVKMYVGEGCHSMIGRHGLEQVISLGKGCYHIGTVIHEMMHAIGFWHEQSRSDRDQYIDIFLDNVKPDKRHNFNKRAPNQNRLLVAWDYNSIMIYGEKSFSMNGQPTMLAKNRSIHITDANKKQAFAASDIEAINKLYHC